MVKKTATSTTRGELARSKGRNSTKKTITSTSRTTKQAISLRIDADVLEWFRAAGTKYQTRMNDVLRDYMKRKNKN